MQPRELEPLAEQFEKRWDDTAMDFNGQVFQSGILSLVHVPDQGPQTPLEGDGHC